MTASKTLVIMIGPHGSGKSSLGSSIANEARLPFYSEIGNELRAQTTDSVSDPQPSFDLEVLRRELSRDREMLAAEDRLSIVESWHIGNLGFARARCSLSVLSKYEATLQRQLQLFRVAPIRLRLSDHEFMQRCRELNISAADALLFYRKLEMHLDYVLDEFREKFVGSLDLPPDLDSSSAIRMSMEWLSGVRGVST